MDSDGSNDSSASSRYNVDVGGVEVVRSKDPQETKLNEDDNSNVTSSIPVLEPCVGMEFESEDDAYNFYNAYGKEMGFSVQKFRVECSRVEFTGGEQNGSVSEEHCRNIFKTKHRKILGVDCQLAVNYLKSKGISDAQFFYAISMDAEQRLTSTTQRGESMNKYFKGFFSPSTPIYEFITQYDETVKKRREKKVNADIKCMTSLPCLHTKQKIEKQARLVYIAKVFGVFLKEWCACFGLVAKVIEFDTHERRYRVFSVDGSQEIDLNYVVDNEDGEMSSCSCKKFEQLGLLCRHILKVYVITDRSEIPQTYVLRRWTKGANTSVGEHRGGSSQQQTLQPIWLLQDIANRISSEGSLSTERLMDMQVMRTVNLTINEICITIRRLHI
ncbi:protein FAR1-RELATED SEQUENCE 3-like [Telopea speciosissima]|uniref:protein FAR1-RELATED SEQUENCE 3-like n=1 Tax=Telopea speciosissima TaxID=54955 RepID=UPI001CC33F4A|nr:protein FAR1-RELATED SEQUENCE 3-like [Telopea speciosissima]